MTANQTKEDSTIEEAASTEAVKLEFGEIPKVRRNGGRKPKYVGVAQALKQKPGEWARLPIHGKTISATHAKKLAAFAGDNFEFSSREGQLYGRYVGQHSKDVEKQKSATTKAS